MRTEHMAHYRRVYNELILQDEGHSKVDIEQIKFKINELN